MSKFDGFIQLKSVKDIDDVRFGNVEMRFRYKSNLLYALLLFFNLYHSKIYINGFGSPFNSNYKIMIRRMDQKFVRQRHRTMYNICD